MPGVWLTHGALSSKCQSNSDTLKRSSNKKLSLCLTCYQSPPEHDVVLSTGYQSKMNSLMTLSVRDSCANEAVQENQVFNASSKSSNGTSCQAWQSPTVPLLRKRCSCELVFQFNLWQTPFNLICLHNINMRAHTSTPPGCITRRAKVRGQWGRTENWSGKHISLGGYSYTHIQYTCTHAHKH